MRVVQLFGAGEFLTGDHFVAGDYPEFQRTFDRPMRFIDNVHQKSDVWPTILLAQCLGSNAENVQLGLVGGSCPDEVCGLFDTRDGAQIDSRITFGATEDKRIVSRWVFGQ